MVSQMKLRSFEDIHMFEERRLVQIGGVFGVILDHGALRRDETSSSFYCLGDNSYWIWRFRSSGGSHGVHLACDIELKRIKKALKLMG